MRSDDQATSVINLVGVTSAEFTRINCVQQALGFVYVRSPGGSTIMFCYYLLAGDTAAPSELYARLCHPFLVFFFFLLEIMVVLTLTASVTQLRFHLYLRSLQNTNRKSYLASRMQPSACCSDDRKWCRKSPLAPTDLGVAKLLLSTV